MNKTVWIINHYAGNMYTVRGGRHYFMAKYLKEKGYTPVIFCSNYDHFTRRNCVEGKNLWTEKYESKTGVTYVFIRTREYSNNGVQRIFNMIDFYRGILRIAKTYATKHGLPGTIYASSVHPLTLVAGIKLAKRFGVKCISEVRDLWPESIAAYSSKWKRKIPIMKALYAGEKWIYKKSNEVVFTMEGGYDYIIERGWEKEIAPSLKYKLFATGINTIGTKAALNILILGRK